MINEIKNTIKKRLYKYKLVNVDYMKVINSNQIRNVDDEVIFGTTSRPTEEEYRLELEKMQWCFDAYEKYKSIDAIEQLIKESLELENKDYEDLNMQEIQKIKSMMSHIKNSYFGGRRVETKKTIDGYYEVTDDGRHRMYVAKKYGLKLVVHVSKEVKKI